MDGNPVVWWTWTQVTAIIQRVPNPSLLVAPVQDHPLAQRVPSPSLVALDHHTLLLKVPNLVTTQRVQREQRVQALTARVPRALTPTARVPNLVVVELLLEILLAIGVQPLLGRAPMIGLPAGLMATTTTLTLTSSKAATQRVPRAQARTARVPNLVVLDQAQRASQRVPRAQALTARVPKAQLTLATLRVPSLVVADPAQILGVHLSTLCLVAVILMLVVGPGGDEFTFSDSHLIRSVCF
jgi:hypothetical protein